MTTAEDHLIARETLAEALAAVTDEQAVVLLFALLGYNYSTIGRLTGCTQQAASGKFKRALRTIQAMRVVD